MIYANKSGELAKIIGGSLSKPRLLPEGSRVCHIVPMGVHWGRTNIRPPTLHALRWKIYWKRP